MPDFAVVSSAAKQNVCLSPTPVCWSSAEACMPNYVVNVIFYIYTVYNNYCKVYICYAIRYFSIFQPMNRRAFESTILFTRKSMTGPRNQEFGPGEHFSDHCRHLIRQNKTSGRHPGQGRSRPRNQAYCPDEHSLKHCRHIHPTQRFLPSNR